jgi:tetratricopeptide (TPR) repeat protein
LLAGTGYRQMLEHIWSLRSPLTNLGWQVDGVFYLLTQPLLTLHTNIDPDLRPLGLADPVWWLKLLGLLVLLAWAIAARRSLSGFAVLWFVLHLLPTNSLWPRNDIANDRQLYLAMLGPALLLARALTSLPPRTAVLSAALLLFGLGWSTVQRNNDYRDEISLWQATARTSPHKARVWNNLGYAYQLAGRTEDARSAYIYAQVLDPNSFRARVNHLLLPEVVPGAPRD